LQAARLTGLADDRGAEGGDLGIAPACQLIGVRVRIDLFHAKDK